MLRVFSINLSTCFILGSVPVAFGYIYSGHEGMNNAIKAILPLKAGLLYALILFGLLTLIAWIEKTFLQRTEPTKDIFSFFIAILSQVGTGIQGIIQAVAGGLIIFPIIWMIEDLHGFRAAQGGLVLFTGFVYVALSYGISLIYVHLFSWKESRLANSLVFEKTLLKSLRN
jgi:hypothetical protein